jgi:hypothetical protein
MRLAHVTDATLKPSNKATRDEFDQVAVHPLAPLLSICQLLRWHLPLPEGCKCAACFGPEKRRCSAYEPLLGWTIDPLDRATAHPPAWAWSASRGEQMITL